MVPMAIAWPEALTLRQLMAQLGGNGRGVHGVAASAMNRARMEWWW
jgi:hypothetical protein